MQIREVIDERTNRLEIIQLTSETFMDQKILKGLSRILRAGGTMEIETEDGYRGTIHFPGAGEESS